MPSALSFVSIAENRENEKRGKIANNIICNFFLEQLFWFNCVRHSVTGQLHLLYPLSGACPPYGARPASSCRAPSATYNRG